MNRERYAEDAWQGRARNTKALIALALWSAGCGLLYLGWNATQTLPLPGKDALATLLYLITFFYVFAIWPIHSLVERLHRPPRRGDAQRPPDAADQPASCRDPGVVEDPSSKTQELSVKPLC